MHSHSTRSALAAFVAAAALVAGCGGSSSNDTNGGGGGGNDSTALKASDLNATPRDQLKQGGTLRWGIDEFPSQYNYNQIDGTTDPAAQIDWAIMPRPFRVDPQAKITPNTNYVTSAEVTSTSPQVVTYKLNPKAKWSDGKPITWRDYEAEWNALRDANGPYKLTSATGYERISSVKAGSDEYEVVVTFAKPFGEWQTLFDPLYPRATNADPKSFEDDYKGKIPVTAGAFRLKKIDNTAKTITVERDPNWWGPPAKLDAIVYRALPQDAIVGAFANGEVDFGDLGADPNAYKRASGVAGGELREAGGPDFRHFTINGSGPILKDLKVRQAVAMALNREVLARADLTGLNWPARTMGNHFLVNTQNGYADNSGAVGTFDPAKARTLLDQAGWTLSGNVRKKAGKTLTLRFIIPSQVATSRQESELAQKMLQDVGVKLDVQTVPSDDFFTKYVTPGNFDITPFSWIGTPYPISSAKSIYTNPAKDSKGELQIQQNYARTGSPQIDKLMNDAEESVDPAKAFDLINQADRQIWEAVHSIILYQRPQITAVKSTLANIGAFGLAFKNYEDMGFTQ